MKKKSLYLSLFIAPTLVPFFATSCSKIEEINASNKEFYDEIWNLSMSEIDNNQIQNSVYSMKVSEFENIINDHLKNNKTARKMMKFYSYYLLKEAIKNPYQRDGKKITTIGNDLKEYDELLAKRIYSDDSSSDKKTYKNANKFIEKFSNFKINVLPFVNNENNEVVIDRERTIGSIVSNQNTLEKLNFQFEFTVDDDELNEKIVGSNDKSIFLTTQKTKSERREITKFKNNDDVFPYINNQFTYQGTKMFYDLETRTFKTIVLPSSVRKSLLTSTKPSGFINEVDTTRNIFWFDYKKVGKKTWETIFVMDLSGKYFDKNLSSDWTNLLKEQKVFVDEKDSKIEIKLNRKITFEENEEQN